MTQKKEKVNTMIKLSYYLGRKVVVNFKSGYTMKGLFEHYKDNEYYLVLRDGSRSYFKSNTINWIKYKE